MIPAFWPWLLVAAVSAGSGAGIAWRVATDRSAQRLMQCEHARVADAREAAEKTAALFARSQAAEAEATRELAAAQDAAERKLKEALHEIDRLATGRECLSGPLRMRLNAAIATDGGLPEDSGTVDPAPAAAADDTAVATWALDAARAYESCRERLDAIRQWDAMTFGEAHGR